MRLPLRMPLSSGSAGEAPAPVPARLGNGPEGIEPAGRAVEKRSRKALTHGELQNRPSKLEFVMLDAVEMRAPLRTEVDTDIVSSS